MMSSSFFEQVLGAVHFPRFGFILLRVLLSACYSLFHRSYNFFLTREYQSLNGMGINFAGFIAASFAILSAVSFSSLPTWLGTYIRPISLPAVIFWWSFWDSLCTRWFVTVWFLILLIEMSESVAIIYSLWGVLLTISSAIPIAVSSAVRIPSADALLIVVSITAAALTPHSCFDPSVYIILWSLYAFVECTHTELPRSQAVQLRHRFLLHTCIADLLHKEVKPLLDLIPQFRFVAPSKRRFSRADLKGQVKAWLTWKTLTLRRLPYECRARMGTYTHWKLS